MMPPSDIDFAEALGEITWLHGREAGRFSKWEAKFIHDMELDYHFLMRDLTYEQQQKILEIHRKVSRRLDELLRGGSR